MELVFHRWRNVDHVRAHPNILCHNINQFLLLFFISSERDWNFYWIYPIYEAKFPPPDGWLHISCHWTTQHPRHNVFIHLFVSYKIRIGCSACGTRFALPLSLSVSLSFPLFSIFVFPLWYSCLRNILAEKYECLSVCFGFGYWIHWVGRYARCSDCICCCCCCHKAAPGTGVLGVFDIMLY